MALGAEAASAQNTTGEAFAAYALDFCAAVVDGQSPETARAATCARSNAGRPEARGRALDAVTRVLKGDADTPIYILSPPDDGADPIGLRARRRAELHDLHGPRQRIARTLCRRL
jgi:hypothetical protein